MSAEAAPTALASAAVFCGLVFMSDRPRGALVAQCGLALASVLVFAAMIADGPVAWVSPRMLTAFAIGIISASLAGMLYHLYLGRFESVWAARGVFTVVYLLVAGLFGSVFLALI